jgi:release factor glutamine methyltransferase
VNDSELLAGRTSWRALLAATADRLSAAGAESADATARLLVEEASGGRGAAMLLGLAEAAEPAAEQHLEAMVQRCLAGEPLQYVLGHWAFRTLDLLVDPRVLIPRPETELVAEHALAELDRRTARRRADAPVVVDLGTGSGALALAIAVEGPTAEVWAVERSAAALSVARANLCASAAAAGTVHLAEGSWFEPLPARLRGEVDVLVSNPPYVADDEVLPGVVVDHEPRAALFSGPTGLEAVELIVAEAPRWLAGGGALVLEIGASQGAAARSLASAAGFPAVDVHRDLAGRDRILVARTQDPMAP